MSELKSGWSVLVHREAKKELGRLPKHILREALERIGALAQEPYPIGCTKIAGQESLYRIRVGDWRIVYEVDVQARTITILRVSPRGEVYRMR